MAASPPPPFELPSETLPTVDNLPNPVIMPDVQFSKDTFNAEMEKSKPIDGEVGPVGTVGPTGHPGDKGAEGPEKPETKPEPEAIPEKGTTDDKKVETPTETPAARSNLPEELLTGKKAEPKPDDAIAEIDAMVLPKNAKPEQVASFSKLKAEAKRIIEERTSRITELEANSSNGNGASKAEIESAQERVKLAESKAAELEQTIERIAFTESPRFKQYINDETATLANAKTYLEGTEIDPQVIEFAARVNGAKRIRVLQEAGADPNIIAAVSPYLAQFDNIQRYKTGALENWKAEQGQFLEQQKVVQQQQMEQRRKAEDDVWSQVVSETSSLDPYRKFDKNDPWNARADELNQKGKTIYNGEGVDLKEVGITIRKGIAFDAEHDIRMAITEELRNALAENAKLKSARPGASNGQSSTGISNDATLSPTEASKARFNRELAAARGG